MELLARRIAESRAEMADLIAALGHPDNERIARAAVRLRSGMDLIERTAILLAAGNPERTDEIATSVCALQDAVYPLLASVSDELRPVVRRYLLAAGVSALARYRTGPGGGVEADGLELSGISLERADMSAARLVGATLLDVTAQGVNLAHARASGSRFSRVTMRESTLRGIKLNESLLEDSAFDRADLDRSRWDGAIAIRCSLAGASLVDCSIGEALFIECDLRGANLSVVNAGALPRTAQARFIRCDLRETSWRGRDAQHVSLIDCRLHGLIGFVPAANTIITLPDYSPGGNGATVAPRASNLERFQ